MNNLMNQIGPYLLLFLPHMVIIFLGVGMVIALCLLTVKNKQNDFYQYYSTPVRDSENKRSIFDAIFRGVGIIYVEFAIVLMSVVFSMSVYEIKDIDLQRNYVIFTNIASSMAQKSLSWLAIIITLVAMLVAFRKDYYLVFSVPDVLEQYKFKKRTLSVLNMVVIAEIFDVAQTCSNIQTFNTAFKMVIIIAYIRALVLCIYLIYRVMDILYSQDKNELKLLEKLHLKARNKLLVSPACYNENVAGTLINCNYLCERHMNEYYKIDKLRLKNVKLQSVHKEKLNQVYKGVIDSIAKKVNGYLFIVSPIYILIFISLAIYKNIYLFNIFKMLFVSWGSWGVIFLFMKVNQKSKLIRMKQILNRMFYSDYVFLSEDDKGKTVITSTNGLGTPNKEGWYIKSILNIAIYWKIILTGGIEKNIDAFKQGLEENCTIYGEGKEEFHATVLPLCYFMEYMSIDEIKKPSFWEEMRNKPWLEDALKKQNKSMLIEILSYIYVSGSQDNISQSFGEYIVKIKDICKEHKVHH